MSRRVAVVLGIFGALGAGLLMVGSASAAFPGANGRIAWAHVGDTNTDIVAADPNGQNLTPLTTDPADDDYPSYSADGERIVFTRFGGAGGNGQIWVMNANGSGQTQLTQGSDTADDLSPGFSPDGTRIVFDRFDGATVQVWVMNADGSGQKQLTTPGANGDEAFDAQFSPDGQKIAFHSEDGATGFATIGVMNADGSGRTSVTTGSATAQAFHPDWSPDGQKIVYDLYDGTEDHLVTINATGGGQTTISDAGFDTGPVYSPDGANVAFSRSNAGLTVSNILTASSTGLNQGIAPVTQDADPLQNFDPAWQPLNPPVCELGGKPTSKSTKKVKVTVTCPTENATVTVAGSGKAPKPRAVAAKKGKKFKIPPVTAPVPAGVPTEVTLKVSKKGQKALKKATKAGKKGKATLTATATDDLGQSAEDTAKVKFKPKK